MEFQHEKTDGNYPDKKNNDEERLPREKNNAEEAFLTDDINSAGDPEAAECPESDIKKRARKAAVKRFWVSVRVGAAYFGYLILFLATFAVMLLLLTLAAVGIPMGIIFGVFGVAIEMFKADFIITELAPELMIFGGLTAACGTAFCGLLAVKAGFMVSRLFLKIKRRCDKLRGW